MRRWERGASRPTSSLLAAYLDLVGVAPEQLEPDHDEKVEAAEARQAELAQRLRGRRRVLGITQAQAAAQIGVAQATYAGWEIARSMPGRDSAAALATFLDAPLLELQRLLVTPLPADMDDWPLFGRIVGERRIVLGIDRRQLAERLGLSPRTIEAWELGTKRPRERQLPPLAEELGVETAVLIAALPDDTPPSPLGQVIRRRQRLLGFSRDDIARKVGVDGATISRWAWGRNAPGDAHIRRLAIALELDEDVFRRQGELPARERLPLS